jgi:ribosomal protein L11 methyltransferase
MDYIKYFIDCQDKDEDYRQIVIADLAEMGFESFEETESGINAYIQAINIDNDIFNSYISDEGIKVEFEYIVSKNWNEVWESGFSPVVVDNKLFIHAAFHEPSIEHELNICITPKMSFGTGHHSTTQLICRYLLETDFSRLSVLDMGTGTGVLAILAFKLGADKIVATEIEDFALENCADNFRVNGLNDYTLIDYRKNAGPYGEFDCIIANINRNILIEQSKMYVGSLKSDAKLFISGFYESDLNDIQHVFEGLGLTFSGSMVMDNWCAALFHNLK